MFYTCTFGSGVYVAQYANTGLYVCSIKTIYCQQHVEKSKKTTDGKILTFQLIQFLTEIRNRFLYIFIGNINKVALYK